MIQLTEKDIINNCRSITFNRGSEYYSKNNVSFISSDLIKNNYDMSVVNIDAAVWGSYGSLYDVVISFNERKRFLHLYCDCEYHHSTGDMCKHMVAVLLKYINNNKGNFTLFGNPVDKSSKFLDIVEKELQGITYKDELSLQVNLKIVKTNYETLFSADLKVGMKKLYVIKDLSQFFFNVKNKLPFEFGKLFNYDPSTQEFNVEDSAIIDFFIELDEINSQYLSVPYNHRIVRGKSVILTERSFKHLLDLLHNKTFNTDFFDVTIDNMSIFKEKLPLSFKLYRSNNLFVVKNDEELPIPLISDHSYYLYDGNIYCPPDSQKRIFRHFYSSFKEKNEVTVLEKDYNRISSVIFPAISELCTDVKVHKDIKEEINTSQLSTSLYLDKEGHSVSCRIKFSYGEESFNPFSKQKSIGMIFRNMNKEKNIIDYLKTMGFSLMKNERLFMDNEEDILSLLKNSFDNLQKDCEIFYSDSFRNMKVYGNTKIHSQVRINDEDLLEFSFNIEGVDATELKSLISSINFKKKYFRLKDGGFLSLANEDTQAFFNNLEYLGINESDFKKESFLFPKYKAITMKHILEDNELVDLEIDNNYRELMLKINNISNEEFPVPESLSGILRDYQKTGFSWFNTLSSCGLGGILADEMGLGKTLQAISFILQEKENGIKTPALVVAPTSLIYNWESEINRFANNLRTLVISGNKKKRVSQIETLDDYDVVITSYPLIRSDIEELEEKTFSSFFIDEAQFIKNHTSMSAVAVKKINSSVKFALTGTPIENNLSELWSIFDFIMPGYLNSYTNFKNLYETPISKENDGYILKRLNTVIKPFILRRHKIDVIDELPPKITQEFVVELTDEQKKIYSSFVEDYKNELDTSIKDVGVNQSKFKLLAILTRLRQICCDPSIFIEDYKGESAKIIALCDIVQSSLEENHRILIFSQFTSILKNIREKFNELGISSFYLDGSTPSEERLKLVNRFNEGENDVFLISLKAGGTGLNLIGADTVIHFDPWWNPAVESQATDRAHRIGQVKTVEVIKLITKGTIEEKIAKLQEKKKELFDNIVENASDNNILKSMSESDIRDLFRE